jgi:pimeloyl-ACP methyl ester carboxylesterase
LTYFLHVDNGHYWDIDGSSGDTPVIVVNQTQLAGEYRNSLLLGPASRGFSGYYVGQHEFDLYEAWADVARHYTLDPTRTSVLGYSMGSYGTYRTALLSPHLFARAVAVAPPMCRGLWLIASCSTTEDTVLARWTENARNLPIFHLADALSETTFYPGQAQLVLGRPINGFHGLDSLGYRYKLWSVAADHLALGLDHPQITAFLGQAQVEQAPFHVTYARMPSTDLPQYGLRHDRAYWLSGITLRDDADPLAKGVVDAVSLGFGLSDPASYQTVSPGSTKAGLPYVETERRWASPGTVRPANRIVLDAHNIGSITIDPVAAHVTCDVTVDIRSDGPLDVLLLGCPRR